MKEPSVQRPLLRSAAIGAHVRHWVAVGQMSPDRAAELLGVELGKIAPWLAPAD